MLVFLQLVQHVVCNWIFALPNGISDLDSLDGKIDEICAVVDSNRNYS